MTGLDPDRREQISDNLAHVYDRIGRACQRSGRSAGDVRLVVVTKTFPSSDVELLAELGCTDIAENRDQEARQKSAEVSVPSDLRWHMIGQLQRNKARSVAGWADVVESVDRTEIARALSAATQVTGRILEVLIQVSLDPFAVPGRGGVAPSAAEALAADCLELPGLRLVGVMGVAPHPGDPRAAFGLLAEVRDRLRLVEPDCWQMSAGMSDDLEEAIDAGATQVRIGGAVLGNRPMLK
jgi:pyridoxal phosphate enzyme (YggS family)